MFALPQLGVKFQLAEVRKHLETDVTAVRLVFVEVDTDVHAQINRVLENQSDQNH